jgi:hypothetical protein
VSYHEVAKNFIQTTFAGFVEIYYKKEVFDSMIGKIPKQIERKRG